MTLETFLLSYFESRLSHTDILMVYDPEGLYRDVVASLQVEDRTVVDVSESTIEGRERVMAAWRNLSKSTPGQAQLLVYLPSPAPRDDKAKRADPYSIFGLEERQVFPNGDGEGFQALCRRACPERAAQMDALFQGGRPDFATINKLLSGGTGWPKLKTLLKAESPVEILRAFLCPDAERREKLDGDASWRPELASFLEAVLGLDLKTKSNKANTIAEEIWRYVMFSEFAFDLPSELPAALGTVPRALPEHRETVYALCDSLRAHQDCQEAYLSAAERVAKELNLFDRTREVVDFGVRDTFAFEEASYLERFSQAAQSEDLEKARSISSRRNDSIWVKNQGERRQLWNLADLTLRLMTEAEDVLGLLKRGSVRVEALFDLYSGRIRNLDAHHRAFEQAVAEVYGELYCLADLVPVARKRFQAAADAVQSAFVQAVEREGWPVSGKPRHLQVFSRFVQPLLQQGKRTAFFMVDALRYELAAELEKEFAGKQQTRLHAVCGQLPSVTVVGMAAVLPGADTGFRIREEKGKLVPSVGTRDVTNPAERLEVLKEHYGDKCMMIDLDELLQKSKLNFPASIKLLAVKTTDIDSIAETKPFEALSAIPSQLCKVRAGVQKLLKAGFDAAVIVTDHGFLINFSAQAGNKVTKPSGDWAVQKDRVLLGKGQHASAVFVAESAALGVPTDLESLALPRSLGAFVENKLYAHGGLSLPECVLPVLVVSGDRESREGHGEQPSLVMTYKGRSSGTITTRRPMVELALHRTGLFPEPIEFSVSAWAGKELVGEAAQGPHVNEATRLVRMEPGSTLKVTLKMEEDFEGAFVVRASDPETGVLHASMKLKTDYMG